MEGDEEHESFPKTTTGTIDKQIACLINGFIRDRLSVAEHEELDNWVTHSMVNQELFEILTAGLTLHDKNRLLRLPFVF